MVVDLSSGNNYNVISIVVGRHVVSDIVELDFLGEISITFNWLSEHVVTETVEMARLKGSLLQSLVTKIVFSGNLILEKSEFGRVQ